MYALLLVGLSYDVSLSMLPKRRREIIRVLLRSISRASGAPQRTMTPPVSYPIRCGSRSPAVRQLPQGREFPEGYAASPRITTPEA